MKRLPLAVILCVLCAASGAQAARMIAVLPLDTSNAEGKLTKAGSVDLEEMLRDVAADTLTSEGWTVLTGETTLQVLQDNGVDASKCGDQSCALSMAREIKAEKFLSGNVRYVDGSFTASIRLIDTGTGRILSSASIEGENVRTLRKDFEKKSERLFKKGGLLGKEAAAPVAPVVEPPAQPAPVAPVVEPPQPPAPPIVLQPPAPVLQPPAPVETAKPLPLAAVAPPPPRPKSPVLHAAGIAGLIAGGVVLLAAGALELTAQSDAKTFKAAPHDGAQVASTVTSINSRHTSAVIGAPIGLAALVGGTVLTVVF